MKYYYHIVEEDGERYFGFKNTRTNNLSSVQFHTEGIPRLYESYAKALLGLTHWASKNAERMLNVGENRFRIYTNMNTDSFVLKIISVKLTEVGHDLNITAVSSVEG